MSADRSPVAWNDFVRDDEAGGLQGIEGAEFWRSTEYTVRRMELEDGSVWLSLSRYGRRGTVRSWRHLQTIKNTIVGPEREAVEIFPAESRLVDTTDQYHLWCLPEGRKVPYGYAERDVQGPAMARLVGSTQTPFEEGVVPPEGPEPLSEQVANMRPPRFIGPLPTYVRAQEVKVREMLTALPEDDPMHELAEWVLDT